MWIFFRVETEWVRNTSAGGGVVGSVFAGDDLMMGDWKSDSE